MAETRAPVLTGGCQCGAVRFAAYTEPVDVGICHCRMCQKAFGGPFASLAGFKHADFAWTRGQPGTFRSSSVATRGFCATCGTPLTMQAGDEGVIEVATGAFDEPARVAPTFEVGTEAKLGWLAGIAGFPGRSTAQASGEAKIARIVSYQHPDHDTGADWAPEAKL